MTICGNRHDEVCYEVRSCPVCEIVRDLKDITEERDAIQRKYDDHECEAP